MMVSNPTPPVDKKDIQLTEEEKRRLVAYMNVLIEMDRTTDKNATNETQY